MTSASQNDLFGYIRELADESVWTRAVQLSRLARFEEFAANEESVRIRVSAPGKIVSPTVTLDAQEQIWLCDCSDSDDPCVHVIAAAIMFRAGKTIGIDTPDVEKRAGHIEYCFFNRNAGLALQRFLVQGDHSVLLSQPLTDYLGGIQSGRIKGIAPVTSREDIDIDVLLRGSPTSVIQTSLMRLILQRLKDCPYVKLDDAQIKVSGAPEKISLEVIDEANGIRVRRARSALLLEIYSNGAAVAGGALCPFELPKVPSEHSAAMGESGRFYGPDQIQKLAVEVLPELNTLASVEVKTARLPEVLELEPALELQTETLDGQKLVVTPCIVYGSPPLARAWANGFEYLHPKKAPRRNLEKERELERKLRADFHLRLGSPLTLSGAEAVRFFDRPLPFQIRGEGANAFRRRGELKPEIEFSEAGLNISFQAPGGGELGGLSAERVYNAWKRGEPLISLPEGGWASLPAEWLERHGPYLRRLLDEIQQKGRVPRYRWPEIAEWTEEEGGRLGASVSGFCEQLRLKGEQAEEALPAECAGVMRDYQKAGSRWLKFLCDHQMGALLADDMGLGKTLQAMAAVVGRTLVIAPTSVMSAWIEQTKRFRPSLTTMLYHGSGRKLDESVNLTVTTYGVLRLDLLILEAVDWDLVILDEAQMIKNPSSQMAQSAFRLRAKSRIALSGTPVENDLEDLWSQLHFLNPDLLGTRAEFQRRFASGTDGAEGGKSLSAVVRPFILRREKKDVEAALPSKTEMNLVADFDSEERALYESLLLAARADVVQMLESGGSVLSALEVILRLRQACCHRSLVPGQAAETSSKLELLFESIEQSLAQGHKALIFSQWTSFLDLIEAGLQRRSIKQLRLDGATRNRAEVVEKFQTEESVSVMLLSLRAGGTGITLTAADHVYLTDPWWNPAVENQAADRAHRIGQERPVMIFRLIVRDSIEEKILSLQEKKRLIAEGVLGDGSAALNLSRADIIELLSGP